MGIKEGIRSDAKSGVFPIRKYPKLNGTNQYINIVPFRPKSKRLEVLIDFKVEILTNINWKCLLGGPDLRLSLQNQSAGIPGALTLTYRLVGGGVNQITFNQVPYIVAGERSKVKFVLDVYKKTATFINKGISQTISLSTNPFVGDLMFSRIGANPMDVGGPDYFPGVIYGLSIKDPTRLQGGNFIPFERSNNQFAQFPTLTLPGGFEIEFEAVRRDTAILGGSDNYQFRLNLLNTDHPTSPDTLEFVHMNADGVTPTYSGWIGALAGVEYGEHFHAFIKGKVGGTASLTVNGVKHAYARPVVSTLQIDKIGTDHNDNSSYGAAIAYMRIKCLVTGEEYHYRAKDDRTPVVENVSNVDEYGQNVFSNGDFKNGTEGVVNPDTNNVVELTAANGVLSFKSTGRTAYPGVNIDFDTEPGEVYRVTGFAYRGGIHSSTGVEMQIRDKYSSNYLAGAENYALRYTNSKYPKLIDQIVVAESDKAYLKLQINDAESKGETGYWSNINIQKVIRRATATKGANLVKESAWVPTGKIEVTKDEGKFVLKTTSDNTDWTSGIQQTITGLVVGKQYTLRYRQIGLGSTHRTRAILHTFNEVHYANVGKDMFINFTATSTQTQLSIYVDHNGPNGVSIFKDVEIKQSTHASIYQNDAKVQNMLAFNQEYIPAVARKYVFDKVGQVYDMIGTIGDEVFNPDNLLIGTGWAKTGTNEFTHTGTTQGEVQSSLADKVLQEGVLYKVTFTAATSGNITVQLGGPPLTWNKYVGVPGYNEVVLPAENTSTINAIRIISGQDGSKITNLSVRPLNKAGLVNIGTADWVKEEEV